MSVQVQVHALSTKMSHHTHTTASVSSVEEQLNDSCTYIMNNFDTYFFLACVKVSNTCTFLQIIY